MNQKITQKKIQIIHFHLKSVIPFYCRAVQGCAETKVCLNPEEIEGKN